MKKVQRLAQKSNPFDFSWENLIIPFLRDRMKFIFNQQTTECWQWRKAVRELIVRIEINKFLVLSVCDPFDTIFRGCKTNPEMVVFVSPFQHLEIGNKLNFAAK